MYFDTYTLLHELACNIVSYCTSGRGIFTSRRRVKMQPTLLDCLISSVTPDLYCWETASGGRQARKMAATVTRLNIVPSILGTLYPQNLLFVLQFTQYSLCTATRAWDWQSNKLQLFSFLHLSLLRSWPWDSSEIWLVEVTHSYLLPWHFDYSCLCWRDKIKSPLEP